MHLVRNQHHLHSADIIYIFDPTVPLPIPTNQDFYCTIPLQKNDLANTSQSFMLKWLVSCKQERKSLDET